MGDEKAKQRLSGWGRVPSLDCRVALPHTMRALRSRVLDADAGTTIARGLGRSYGDSSLNDDGVVVVQTRLNRMLEFDAESGVLHCEAGVSLAEVIECLLPRGWFLPTTPGTRFVTIGGAIAADVHGKNHHRDGSFGQHVSELTLMDARGTLHICSPAQNTALFWATVGGMGLTGMIVSARIRLHPVETAYQCMTRVRTRDLDETLERFDRQDHLYRYSVAWIDGQATGKSLGRSVIMWANDALRDDLPRSLRHTPLNVAASGARHIPCDFPAFALNAHSVRAFNAVYYASQRDTDKIVDYASYFYPLDSLRHWNRIYGKRGFIQYQALFPTETAREGLRRLLETIAASGNASFLAVLKRSGAASPAPLSYLYPGYSLALDLPHSGKHLEQLVSQLDAILLESGGRLYLAKDALMSAQTFQQMYPRLEAFREVKALVDPNQRFVSVQARRVGIVPS